MFWTVLFLSLSVKSIQKHRFHRNEDGQTYERPFKFVDPHVYIFFGFSLSLKNLIAYFVRLSKIGLVLGSIFL